MKGPRHPQLLCSKSQWTKIQDQTQVTSNILRYGNFESIKVFGPLFLGWVSYHHWWLAYLNANRKTEPHWFCCILFWIIINYDNCSFAAVVSYLYISKACDSTLIWYRDHTDISKILFTRVFFLGIVDGDMVQSVSAYHIHCQEIDAVGVWVPQGELSQLIVAALSTLECVSLHHTTPHKLLKSPKKACNSVNCQTDQHENGQELSDYSWRGSEIGKYSYNLQLQDCLLSCLLTIWHFKR